MSLLSATREAAERGRAIRAKYRRSTVGELFHDDDADVVSDRGDVTEVAVLFSPFLGSVVVISSRFRETTLSYIRYHVG